MMGGWVHCCWCSFVLCTDAVCAPPVLRRVKPDSTTHAVMSSVTAKGVEQVTEQQALLSALTAAGAAAGAMLIRAGLL